MGTKIATPGWGVAILMLITLRCIFGLLQCGIAEAVDQRLNPTSLFAERTIPIVVALVVRQVVYIVNRAHRIAGYGFRGTVDGGNACHLTAVVAQCLDRALGGCAGGHGGHQDQHMLIPNHGLDILTEDDLRIEEDRAFLSLHR